MHKVIFTSLIVVFLFTNSFSQETSIFYSVGGTYSDIHLTFFDKETEDHIGKKFNSGKHSIFNSLGVKHEFNKFINTELILTYQERLPLENFISAVGIYAFPTSPQSNLWNPNIHIRFPNFKYFHAELIPMFQFKRKITIAAGIGIFYGRLLNQKELVFDRKYFPSFDFFFDPPFNVTDEATYRKNDFGWIPKFAISYPINDKMEIGFSTKAYVSEVVLQTNNLDDNPFGRKLNDTWLVFAYGLEVSYRLGKMKK